MFSRSSPHRHHLHPFSLFSWAYSVINIFSEYYIVSPQLIPSLPGSLWSSTAAAPQFSITSVNLSIVRSIPQLPSQTLLFTANPHHLVSLHQQLPNNQLSPPSLCLCHLKTRVFFLLLSPKTVNFPAFSSIVTITGSTSISAITMNSPWNILHSSPFPAVLPPTASSLFPCPSKPPNLQLRQRLFIFCKVVHRSLLCLLYYQILNSNLLLIHHVTRVSNTYLSLFFCLSF